MIRIFALLSILLIVGCATPYQKLGDTGGFYHQKMADDVYVIGFRGNGFTEYQRAYDFALLRAAEVCKQLGFSYFSVEGLQDRSRTTIMDMGSTSHTSGSIYGSGSYASYFGTTNTQSNTVPIKKPGVEFAVKYYEVKPEGRILELHAAEEVIQEIKSKYKIQNIPNAQHESK